MKISTKMREKDKVFIALIGTAIVLAGLFFTNNIYEQNKNKALESEVNNSQENSYNEELANLTNTIKPIDTRSLLYSDLELLDLPIYPQAWVEKNFTTSERTNQLISGETADPDSDGLTNKEEYFYGSNPKKTRTLCSNTEDICNKPTDKEAVDDNISPLTGLELTTPDTFTVKKQDIAILNRIEDSFETASREGVDFPTLYQLSREIDLSAEVEQIDILTQQDSRENFINYINTRISIIEEFSEKDDLTNFIEIYQTSEIPKLEETKERYEELEERMINTFTPIRYQEVHKAYIFLFQKFQDLISLRIEGIETSSNETDSFKEESKKTAVELVWTFRSVSELEEQASTANEEAE